MLHSRYNLILIALFAALSVVGAFVKIPTPLVPFTLQTLFCVYAGFLLGARRGFASQLLYLLIGLMGIPVFALGGGPAYVLQPTFGYLLGFLACSGICGYFVERMERVTFMKLFSVGIVGLIAVYAIGLSYLYFIVNVYFGRPMPIGMVLSVGFLPYIVSDLIMNCVIAATAVKIIPALRKNGYLPLVRQKR